MHVQRLRVSGFKSFADAVDLRIEPGLTGVVGPNGCGKSNLLEALRWVMGASSAKAMRADGMDEVIFGGSGGGASSRPMRNYAEVSLQLDNADRSAPAAFNDAAVIEVSRRIHRGEGSIYRVNGAEARARDVQLLFADASSGANSPSLVRQGQISELIAAKPANRRRILEEAAGVSGLHSRRHEAELRLRAAEANLERLDDVARELEAGAARLRREARHAETYRKLGAEIRSVQSAALYGRWSEAERQQATASQTLTQAEARAGETAGGSARAEAAALKAAKTPPGLRDAEMVAAAVLQRLAIERDRLERELQGAREAVERARSEIERVLADSVRETAAREDAAGARDRLARDLADVQRQIDAAPERLPELEAALSDAEHARAAADASVERLAAEAAAAAAAAEAGRRAAAERIAALETARRGAQERLAAAAARRDRTAAALEAARAQAESAPAETSDAPDVSGLVEAEQALEAARAGVEAADVARAQAQGVEQEAREAARRLGDALAALKAEAQGLARSAQAMGRGPHPAAIDRCRPERGFEAALAAALGEDGDAALDPSAPAHWRAGASPRRPPDWPRGATPLGDHVLAPPELAARLAMTALVAVEDGARLAALTPAGARLVSREGDLWRWDGLTVRAEAPRPAAVRLAQKARLQELQAQLMASAPQAEAAAAAFAQAQRTLSAAEAALRPARIAASEAERALAQARETQAARLRESERLAARRAAAAETAERLAADLAEADTACEVTRAELSAAKAALAAIPGGASNAATDLDPNGALDCAGPSDLAAAREASARARTREVLARSARDGEAQARGGRERRREALARDLADWSRRLTAAEARLHDLGKAGAEARAALDRLGAVPAEAEARRSRLLDELAAAETRRAQAADALASAETLRAEAERAARAAASAASEAREARAAAAVRLDAALERRDAVAEEVRRVTGDGPQALARRMAQEAVAAPPDPAGLQAHLEALTLQRDRLGAVNLRAEEELGEATGRLNAMHADRADLTSAIAKLRQGVDALNAEGRERVLAAFATIDKSFRELFATLFEGGQAELKLVENDDPLEAGLEIYACPPGKRLSTMSLMSGGEQALTACALIFAVFLANPAPLCVLDEVDAPLDDANVDRFCRMLDEMRRLTDTRFLAITHNPVTMSRMDRLYGVTMPERGVSQVVSVDLKRAELLAAS